MFFFQNVKLDFAMTLKEQKFAKISIREISKVKKFAKIIIHEIRRSVIYENYFLQKLKSAKITSRENYGQLHSFL